MHLKTGMKGKWEEIISIRWDIFPCKPGMNSFSLM